MRVPGTSIRALATAAPGSSSASAAAAAGIAKARFTNRHQRQDRYSVSAPPSSRPRAAPLTTTLPKTPNARPRSSGSLNVVVRSDSAVGASSAANAPCSARAPTSTPKLWAAPPTAEATAKPIRPTTRVGLRPRLSPIRPPTSSRLPNASV